MTSHADAPRWIMEEIFKDGYDAAGCMAVGQLHEFVLHEKELEDEGLINTAPQFKAARAKVADNFAPELLERIKLAHAALPKHRFNP